MDSVLYFNQNSIAGTIASSKVQQVQKSPLWFPLAGHYTNSGATGQGEFARYWSRKAESESSAYNMYIGASNNWFAPQAASSKSDGYSVRCVFN